MRKSIKLEKVQKYLSGLGLVTLGQLNEYAANALDKEVENFWQVSEEDANVLYQLFLMEVEYTMDMEGKRV